MNNQSAVQPVSAMKSKTTGDNERYLISSAEAIMIGDQATNN